MTHLEVDEGLRGGIGGAVGSGKDAAMGADGDQKETCGEKPGGVVIEGQGSPSGGFKMESRKGRERQRYSNGMRLIAGYASLGWRLLYLRVFELIK